MLSALRFHIVVFLAMLQLIAPLVHAHAGEKIPDLGLHVPGLEAYGAKNAGLGLEAVSYTAGAEVMLFSVDTGIRLNPTHADTDVDQSPYLHHEIGLFNAPISPFDTNFSPQTQPFVCRLLIPSLSPRAPPAR